MFICNRKPASRWRAIFPTSSKRSENCPRENFVLDGELAIPVGGALSFDELQLRLHPAASRVQKLAKAHPGIFIVFDLLAQDRQSYLKRVARTSPGSGKVRAREFESERRDPSFARDDQTRNGKKVVRQSRRRSRRRDRKTTRRRLRIRRAHRDDEDQTNPQRRLRGRRISLRERRKVIGSLLLGLYDDDGLLHHVGFTSAFKASERRALTKKFEALRKPPGFTGNAPGGPSRWSTERTGEWEPVDPKIVVEVTYDHFTGGRFRHGTKILRWRPDKAPKQCTMDQVEHREGKSLFCSRFAL